MAVDGTRLRDSSVSVLTLFASASTLLCCAIPILLVSLGMGAAVASLTSSAPWLITLSEHKLWVFSGSLAMLGVGGWFIYRPGRACPTDPHLARACQRMDTINRWVYWGSVGVWLLGFFAAFLLNPLSHWLSVLQNLFTAATSCTCFYKFAGSWLQYILLAAPADAVKVVAGHAFKPAHAVALFY